MLKFMQKFVAPNFTVWRILSIQQRERADEVKSCCSSKNIILQDKEIGTLVEYTRIGIHSTTSLVR